LPHPEFNSAHLTAMRSSGIKKHICKQNDKIDYLPGPNRLYTRLTKSACKRNGRDNLGINLLFPYLNKIKSQNDYYAVHPLAERDAGKLFEAHDIFTVNNQNDTLLDAVPSRLENQRLKLIKEGLIQELLARGIYPKRIKKVLRLPIQ
jgi:hypothetical protein